MKSDPDHLGLFEWHSADEVLNKLERLTTSASYKFFYEKEYKSVREAWVLAKFARLAYRGADFRLRLLKEQFPDAAIHFSEPLSLTAEFEITQAFKKSDELAKSKLPGNRGASFEELETIFIESLLKAMENKASKHYSVRVNLLIYVTNISTWGMFYDLIVRNMTRFERFKKEFLSINILATSAIRAVQLFPEFKVYHSEESLALNTGIAPGTVVFSPNDFWFEA